MILFVIQIIQSLCQYQLTMVQNERFFYKLSDLIETPVQNISIQSPNLGFFIQGGLIESSANLNITSIISSSLYELMNIIAILQLDGEYVISTIQYLYQGDFSQMNNLFNISSLNQICQDILILDQNLIILHCTYINNNSIVIYNYNDTLYQYNGFINPGIESVNIQSYFNFTNGSYDIYIIYGYKFSTQIYYCQLYNNTYSNLELIWNYSAQYIQVYVSQNQEIFALQFNYLMFSYSKYIEKLTIQNESNWIAMNIISINDGFFIQIVDNYSLYEVYFQYQFQILSNQSLPSPIQQAQIFTNLLYSYIKTQNKTFIYQYFNKTQQLYQIYDQSLSINELNLYNTIGNVIIQINNFGINLYQISDYFIYNNNPDQSGYIYLSFNNQSQYQFYINIIPYYDNQIYPIYENFTDQTLLTNNNYFINYNIGQYFIGSNLSYTLSNSTINGLSIINQTNMGANFENIPGLFAISYLNCLIIVQSTLSDKMYFYLAQNNQLDNQYVQILEYSSVGTGEEQYQSFFIEYANGTIMILKVGASSINVYQLQPLINITQSYTLDMDTIQNTKSFNIISGFIEDNIFFFNTDEYYCFIIEIFTTYYDILEQFECNYTYITAQQYDQYYIYATYDNQIDIFVWQYKYLQYYDRITISQATGSLYVFPLISGVYIMYGNVELFYYDKSMFNMNVLGEQFFMIINTTGLSQYYAAYSDYYLYLSIRFNDKNYIYIYQCTNFAINALYQSIQLDEKQNFISVSTDNIRGIDYLSVGASTYLIYEIPHKTHIYQYPNGQLNTQYQIINNITVSNSYYQQQFQLNIIINQPQLQITQNSYLDNIANNQTSSTLQINPYNYFNGIIQSYNISCQQCQNISLNDILTNSSFYINQTTLFSVSYVQNQIQYIYLANQTTIVEFIYQLNTSNYYYQGVIVNYTNNSIIYIFLETNTNSISWMYQQQDQLYICSFINNATMNISISQFNGSNPALNAVYSYGILQIMSAQYYYFYTYLIRNFSINITTYIQNVLINQNNGKIFQKISLYDYEDYYLLGVFYQTVANTIQAFIVEISIIDNIITILGYQNLQLNDLIQYQQDFPFQSFQQLGDTEQIDAYSIVNFIYTTAISGGIIQMRFSGLNLVFQQLRCQFEMLNTSLQNNYTNIFAVQNSQLAVLNVNNQDQRQITSLSLLLVDDEICQQNQQITPYSYILLNQSKSQLYSINYLSQNQLIFSLNDNTYFYQTNQLLSINYNTTTNSSIILTALNQLNSTNQSINIIFSKPNQSNGTDVINKHSNNLDWYWILLMVVVTLIIIMLIISLIYNKYQENRQKDYLKHLDQQNEIEIKGRSNYKQNE